MLLYDHQTESLWSQLMEKAIAGPLVGSSLKKLDSSRVRWKTWKKKHPTTLVLSDDTGYVRDYSINPYKGYYLVGRLMFPVGKVRKDLPAKASILGVSVEEGGAKAYPIEVIRKNSGVLHDTIGNTPIRIEISKDGEITSVKDNEGIAVPHIFSFWFAWQAFHPDTKVYHKNSNDPDRKNWK